MRVGDRQDAEIPEANEQIERVSGIELINVEGPNVAMVDDLQVALRYLVLDDIGELAER